jgi:hypothetical protein
MRSERRATVKSGISSKIGQFLVQLSDRRSTRIISSLSLGAIAGVVEVLAHESLLFSFGAHELAVMGDAIIVAVFVFLLTFVELAAVHERRSRVLRELQVIADLNHHVRNALSAIQYAAYASTDKSNLEIVNTSIERIDHILKELFPVLRDKK